MVDPTLENQPNSPASSLKLLPLLSSDSNPGRLAKTPYSSSAADFTGALSVAADDVEVEVEVVVALGVAAAAAAEVVVGWCLVVVVGMGWLCSQE